MYFSFFGGKQEEGLTRAVENLLKNTDDCELAAIDALASAGQSLVIALGIFRGKLQLEEAIELIRLEEDLQVRFSFCKSLMYIYALACVFYEFIFGTYGHYIW